MKIDREKAIKWLNEKWKGDKLCPVCKTNSWDLPEILGEVRQFQGGGLVVGGPVFPVFPLTCKTCGHTLFFNALVMGIIQPEAKEETKEKEGQPNVTDPRPS